MASLITTINSWTRKSERLQTAYVSAMALFDPANTPLEVRNVLSWLSAPAEANLVGAATNILNAFAAQTFRLRNGGVASSDILSLVDVGGPYDVALLACEANLELLFAPIRSAAYVFNAVEDDLSLADTEINNRLSAAEIIRGALWPSSPVQTNIQSSNVQAISGYNTYSSGGATAMSDFRASVLATVAPAYPGDATNDKLADLFEFVIANKL